MMRVPILVGDLNPLFNKTATFRTVEDGDITGKVLSVSKDGVVARFRGNPRILLLGDIVQFKEVVRPRRKRVIRRVIRRIEGEALKQHLADRHAMFVSLCDAVDAETAKKIHDQISHEHLGHYHRDPEEAMEELDENSDDEVSDE